MSTFLIFGLISVSEATDNKSLRLSVCTGLWDSSCNVAGLRFGGVYKRLGLSIGVDFYNVNGVAQVYVTSPEKDVSAFLYAGLSHGKLGVYNGGLGLDFHFSESRNWIVTPKLGYGLVDGSDMVLNMPGASLEISRVF